MFMLADLRTVVWI